MGQIYLIRHGQASFGSDDYDVLSPLGQEQGRLLGQWFTHNRQAFDRVITGSLKRHRQTAEACMSAMPQGSFPHEEWETDAGFNEFDHAESLLRHRPEFAEPGVVRRFFAEHQEAKHLYQHILAGAMTRWVGGNNDTDYREPWPQFRSRCVNSLHRILESAGPSQNIAVFTSGGPIAGICQELLGLDNDHMMDITWSFVNCSVTKLLYRPGKASISYLNSYAHLEWLGTRESITYR